MLKKDDEHPQLTVDTIEQATAVQRSISIVFVALCTLAFVLCFLVSAGVLRQIASISTYVPMSSQVTFIGLRLLRTLGIQTLTDANLTFTVITGIEFAMYGLGALFIQGQKSERRNIRIFLFIWLGAIIAGSILVVTQALISHDIFVYAGYGRTIVAHGANPYFVAPAAFPQDPVTHLDDWKDVTAAYGPLWLSFCSLVALVAGTNATRYMLLFRLATFAAHLINIILVAAILRTSGRSSRTITLGTFLYAWNPLLLLESCFSGHNDIFMITLILFGVLFCVQGERHGFTRPLHYLPPVVAFTLAGLIKITALPLAALFLILLARKTLYGTANDTLKSWKLASLQWKFAFPKVLFAGITIGLVVVLLYGPFFIGHSVPHIIHSFTAPPSSRIPEHSILKALIGWVGYHGMPLQTSWLYPVLTLLTTYKVWRIINIVLVLSALIVSTIWLWRTPTTRTLVLTSIAVLGPLLIVTTWFYPWYVTWLVGLAAVSIPTSHQRVARALFAFALVFSASARLTYLTAGRQDLVDWDVISCAATIIPPMLTFLFFLCIKKMPWEHTSPESDTNTMVTTK